MCFLYSPSPFKEVESFAKCLPSLYTSSTNLIQDESRLNNWKQRGEEEGRKREGGREGVHEN